MLDMCLDRINQEGTTSSMGVTLIISSTVISGDLIHPTAYFKSVLATLSPTDGQIKGIAEKTESPETTPIDASEIFLKNAKIWKPIPQNTIDNPIAISIDSIDGFIFGKLDLSIKLPEFELPKMHEFRLPKI